MEQVLRGQVRARWDLAALRLLIMEIYRDYHRCSCLGHRVNINTRVAGLGEERWWPIHREQGFLEAPGCGVSPGLIR